MKHNIAFFKRAEFKCKCCGREDTAVALVFWLDVFRRALGLPLRINSGFRCKQHNDYVGGSAQSRHLIACAVDLAKPSGIEYQDFVSMARRLSGAGWEIVTYPGDTYFHLGVPRVEAARLWDGNMEVTL